MGKFLDKAGLQTFLNKLKGIFVNKNNVNECGNKFTLSIINDDKASDNKMIINANGIEQINAVDNYYMGISGAALYAASLNDDGKPNYSYLTCLDSNGLIINTDYGLLSNGELLCDKISSSNNVLIDFTINGFEAIYSGIKLFEGENHFVDKYDANSINSTHPIIYDGLFTFNVLSSSFDTQAWTHLGPNELVIGGDNKLGTIITKDVVVASKIAIGNCTGISEYTITGSHNKALMADGSTANVAILSGKDNNEVPLINQQSFISQDEYVDWSGTYLLLHYPMDVGETTVVHLTISKTNNINVTRIIEIDTINTNSTIKLVIDNNKTSINFNNVNNKEFSGRYRIYCYSSSNSVVYSKL